MGHEIGHVLCLDDLKDNENNVMIEYNSCKEKGFSQGQIENMKKKAIIQNLANIDNNENRTPCTSAIDTIGDVKDKETDNVAPDLGGIDIRIVNTPFLSPGTIDVEIISMSLMGRGDNLHLYYGLGLNTDDNLSTGMYFDGFPGVDRIVHIYLDYIFPFEPPTGSSEVGVTNVENNDYTYVGHAEIRTFVETTKLLNPGPGIRDNVRDGVRARIPLDLLGPMAENVPAIAVAMDLDNWVMDTLTFICKTTVPPAPWMSISSRTGKPGDNVQIVGGGFPAESFFDVFVTLALGGTEVEVAHTAIDENGKFATTFEVPDLPPDNYFLTAIDNEFNSVFLMFTVEPENWVGTATFKLENLYKVGLEKDLQLNTGKKLVVKFYKYDNVTKQAESVIENIVPPQSVKENENVPHPLGAPVPPPKYPGGTVQIVRLVLTTDNENEVISEIASFTVRQIDLRKRCVAILLAWFANPEKHDAFRAEVMDILSQWFPAPP